MGHKILLIEDDDATAGYVAKGLSEAGYSVEVTESFSGVQTTNREK